MTTIRKLAPADVEPNRRRGGDIRLLLSPRTVGATSGFMGVGTLEPGERIIEHFHPYSEEFLYLVRGRLELVLDDGEHTLELCPGEAAMVPMGMRHRLRSTGTEPAFVVFHNGPLAPRPDLGHVDLEPVLEEHPEASVGGPA